MENILHTILEQKDICLICSTEDLEYSFSTNTLLWLSGDEENCITIGDILCYLLKKEQHYYANMVMCSECTRNAVTSYKFMLKCESNEKVTQKLLNGLKKITDMTAAGLTNQDKTVFMQIDTKKGRFNAFCNSKVSKSLSITLEHFKSILDSVNKVVIKQEDHEKSSESNEESDNSSEFVPSDCESYSDSEDKTVICNICSKKFHNRSDRRNHVDATHRPQIIQCNLCDRKFGSTQLLKIHNRKTHIKQTCYICGKMFVNVTNMRDHIESHSMNLQCEKCLKKFTSNKACLKHIERDNCNKPLLERQKYHCKECDAKFSWKLGLKNHIEFKHKGIARFICEICSAKCQTKGMLDKHVRRTHTNIKRTYPCTQCDKVFSSESYVLDHIRVAHSGELAKRCYYCDDKFSGSNQRFQHITSVHRDKMFSCERCNVQFIAKPCLDRHRKSKRCKQKTSNNVMID